MKNKISRIIGASLLGVFVLGATMISSVSAEEQTIIPTRIKADYIQYNTKTGMTQLKGNVIIYRDNGTIKASDGEYNTQTKAGSLTGGVSGRQDDAEIISDSIIMHAGGTHITAKGNAYIKKADKALKAEQVEYYEDKDFMETVGNHAELVMDDGSYLKANYINYDMKNGTALADGNVNIKSDVRNLVASADKASYDTNEDGIITLTGNAKATQNGNTIESDTIKIVNTKMANKQVARATGSVKIVYLPK